MALASRRRFLGYGLAGVVAAAAAGGAGGSELVSRGVLPGKGVLDAIDGACSVAAPDLASYAPPGPQVSGTFYSRARNRDRRLHDRLPARSPAGRGAAAGGDAARLRRQPRQRAVRPVARPGARAPGRRRAASPDGPGDGRRRRRLLEPAPGRQPAGDAHRRGDPAVPAPRPRRRKRRRSAAASASWASRWAATAPCCWRRSART